MNYKMIPILIGMSFCVICSITTLLLPDKQFSEEENRTLQSSPVFSVQGLLSKNILQDTEAYLKDHFIGNPSFTKASRRMQLLSGISKINNVFVLNDRLVSKVRTPNPVTAKRSTEAINTFSQYYQNTSSIYFSLVPTACEVYKEELPHDPNILDQIDVIRKIYNDSSNTAEKENPYGIISGPSCIDTHTSLMAQKTEDIFYHTDSCWTSLGAYTAYSNLITSMGEQYIPKDLFDIEHVSYQYLGNLYNRTLINPTEEGDRIDLYSYAVEPVIKRITKYSGNKTLTTSSLYFEEYLGTKTQEKIFLGEPCGIIKIQTSVDNHQNLLLFGDQLSAPLLQFLSLHFENITFVNLRYFSEEQAQYIPTEEYQTILFLYSIENYLSDNSISLNLPLLS